MRRAFSLVLLSLLIHPAIGQTTPDVAAILRKVSERYTAGTASQYEVMAGTSSHAEGDDKHTSGHMHVAYKAPNHYRMDGALPGMDAEPFSGEALIVYDGDTLWFYFARQNQYGSFPTAALTAHGASDLGDMKPEFVDPSLMGRYRSATDFAGGAKLLRQEAINYGGAKVNCYVLSVSGKDGSSPYTWWIDSTRYLILREDSADSSVVFTSIKLGEPIPDTVFKFEPTARSQESWKSNPDGDPPFRVPHRLRRVA